MYGRLCKFLRIFLSAKCLKNASYIITILLCIAKMIKDLYVRVVCIKIKLIKHIESFHYQTAANKSQEIVTNYKKNSHQSLIT